MQPHSYRNGIIEGTQKTKYPHKNINRLGSYQGLPFITGSKCNKKTEVHNNGEWKEVKDYPFAEW